MRDYLRSLPVFSGVLAEFDPATVPDDPAELFSRWLRAAVDEGVPEPHAMVLATSDAAGYPDARTLILKDLDDRGWWFASNARSAKGIQLGVVAAAALTFYWPQVGRQVRVRGHVVSGTSEASADDFRSRGTAARAVALASRESQPLADRATAVRAIADAERRLADDPGLVAPHWRTYAVRPDTVEFWQADKDRQHVRVQYLRRSGRWTRQLLWP